MYKINATEFYQVIAVLNKVQGVANAAANDKRMDEQFGKNNSELIVESWQPWRKHLEVLGARLTCMAVDTLIAEAKGGKMTGRQLADHTKNIGLRLHDELSLISLFVVDTDKAKFLDQADSLFGSDVSKKFPTISFEIEEAGKCFAVGRYTASVFHLMRTLEVGIRAVSICLSIASPTKDADRNWGAALRKLRDEIERRSKAPSPAWANSTDRAFFLEVHASLDAVRNVWRNATMHVESKYTSEEAEHIFAAVRAFMRKLASRLDEQGLPLA